MSSYLPEPDPRRSDPLAGYVPPSGYSNQASSALTPTAAVPTFAATPPQAPLSTPAPARQRPARRLGALLGVAVLAAGVGGGAAYAVDHSLAPQAATVITGQNGVTTTKVVQGNASNPDWTVTAAAVQKSVVAITVASASGEAEGSGVVWDGNGDIVTNDHVVEALGTGATIQVEQGSQVYAATIVGTDASTDIAVVKVSNTSGLTPITLATAAPTVGQAVMAVGNPLGLSDTVTTGIVSALNRPVVTEQESTSSSQGASPYRGQGSGGQSQSGSSGSADTSSGEVVTNAIQTSAAINPGNSGGGLINANGELIGITSSIASLSSSSSSGSGESGSIGIGFAIPVGQVKSIASQLISSGTATHPYLGVAAADGSATVDGATVLGAKLSSVSSGSAAAQGGLKTGDLVTAINGTPVTSAESLVAQIRALNVGDEVTLTRVRDGSTSKATVTLGRS